MTLCHDVCACGVGDHRCAGKLGLQIDLSHSAEVIEGGTHNAGAQDAAVLCSATKQSLMEVPLRLAGRGSRFVEARHHAEDRLFQRQLLVLRFQ